MFCIIDFWGGCLVLSCLCFCLCFVCVGMPGVGGGVGGFSFKKNILYLVYDFYCILLMKKGAGG